MTGPLVKSYINSRVSKVVDCRDVGFFQSNSKLREAFQRNDLSVRKAKNAANDSVGKDLFASN